MNSKKATSVSVALVGILKNIAERHGIDFVDIAGQEWADSEVFRDGRTRISGKQFEAIWQKIMGLLENPNPGLKFGHEIARSYPGGSVLFTLMMNCATIGDALDMFIRYHRIMSDVIQPHLHRDEERTSLSWQSNREVVSPHPDFSEAVLTIYSCILDKLSQGKLRPIEVCFTHGQKGDIELYQHVFKTLVRFGAPRNELVVSQEMLNTDIALANLELAGILENHAQRIADTLGGHGEWSTKVMRMISNMLLNGARPDVGSVARKLALSKRNLQVKLKDEDTSYRCCLESVRQKIALEYLEKPGGNLYDVTFLLGYSEQSAFNHAFKRWKGMSPQEYLRKRI